MSSEAVCFGSIIAMIVLLAIKIEMIHIEIKDEIKKKIDELLKNKKKEERT